MAMGNILLPEGYLPASEGVVKLKQKAKPRGNFQNNLRALRTFICVLRRHLFIPHAC